MLVPDAVPSRTARERGLRLEVYSCYKVRRNQTLVMHAPKVLIQLIPDVRKVGHSPHVRWGMVHVKVGHSPPKVGHGPHEGGA